MGKREEFDIERIWNDQEPILGSIREKGFSVYGESLADLKQAFTIEDRDLRCIDEGTPGGIHSAGSTILMKKEEAIMALRAAKVSGIYSHAGCGAAGLYAKEHGLPLENADDYSREHARKIAGEMGIPYRGHIGAEEMHRPPEAHIARICYYDGSGSFDYAKSSGLPSGFVISRAYMGRETSLKETAIAISIALGYHGFRERFTKEKPFILVAIGNKENGGTSADELKRELEPLIGEYDGRVVIDIIEAPKKSANQ